MYRNQVVLVDRNDQAIGTMDKMEAHITGTLHRAFSIFIFNSRGEMLLQQRASHKYHGGDLWTNTCCSHPQWEENIRESAQERLYFEMGLQCDIQKAFAFLYHSPVENGLIEHEYDHVFFGYTDTHPTPNPDEVRDYQWTCPVRLQQKIKDQPGHYTYWFRMAVNDVLKKVAGWPHQYHTGINNLQKHSTE